MVRFVSAVLALSLTAPALAQDAPDPEASGAEVPPVEATTPEEPEEDGVAPAPSPTEASPTEAVAEPPAEPAPIEPAVEPTSAATPSDAGESAAPGRFKRKDWDMLGLALDVTSSHTLAAFGPRYQLVAASGLYIDSGAALGVTLRDNGPRTFGQLYGNVGFSLIRGHKQRDAKFNLSQSSSSDMRTTTTTYKYIDTTVTAQRNLIVYGGLRSLVGRGPDLADDKVAPGYLAFAGGVSFLTTWREIQEHHGERRMIRGQHGLELVVLYTPQNSESENFSNFRHWGGELRLNRSAGLGRMDTPFHLGLGIEPGLGPMVRMGMEFPVFSPLSSRYGTAKVGSLK
ncbi:MAG: hypothetical protein KC912_19065 [Proteobacteria bacterium]|nr:hypothetical protein [Pseudomonadota bacterium]